MPLLFRVDVNVSRTQLEEAQMALNITWDSFDGQLPDGDLINVSIEPNAASVDAVEFVLETPTRVNWWKGILVPDGEGSNWEIWTENNRQQDRVALYAHQVRNSQQLEFRKAKFVGVHTGMYLLGGLERLDPGTRVTFRWVQDSVPNRSAVAGRLELELDYISGRGYWAKPGQQFAARIRMTNTGDPTWTSEARYKLGSHFPLDNLIWGSSRLELPGDIRPGATAEFALTAVAPTAPGQYSFTWRMVQEGITWFGEVNGAPVLIAEKRPAPLTAPAPKPPPQTIVPNLVGQTLDVALNDLYGARLTPGLIIDPAPLTQNSRKNVISQSPSSGETVSEGSAVNLSVELIDKPPQGISKVQLYNCHPDGRTVTIWVYDYASASWNRQGPLDSSWSGGFCPTGSPFEVGFETGKLYNVAAIDTQLTGCPGDQPETAGCRRWETIVRGDENGPSWVQVIP